MRDVTYVVVRHGSNAANQPMTPKAVVGTVVAPNRAEAEARALKEFVFYANQTCELIPWSKVSATLAAEAQEADDAHQRDMAENRELFEEAKAAR